MLCGIFYHLYNLRNVKNTHGGVLLIVKVRAENCSFTKYNTAAWVFHIFDLLQMLPNRAKHCVCPCFVLATLLSRDRGICIYMCHDFDQSG